MGAISGPNSAIGKLLSNPEVKEKFLASTKMPDSTPAIEDVSSSLPSNTGISKQSQTMTIIEPTLQKRKRRGGGTIMGSRGLVAGS